MPHILLTGAFGQIGSELSAALRERHGRDAVLTTGRRLPAAAARDGPVAVLDVTDAAAVEALISRHQIDTIYHLAARLSAVAEQAPEPAWRVNVDGLRNVLEAARRQEVAQVFWPSSIAVFGPGIERDRVPQAAPTRPTTIYGIAKVAGELLCDYYAQRYRVDVRGVRYPGIISSGQEPGGGTTDYAVEMFYAAVRGEPYRCFVREDCVLPMMYMPDCVRAALDLMAAPTTALEHRNGFNLAAMSFSAGELAREIERHVPGFACAFEPDERQAIADSWPASLNDDAARSEWGWAPAFDLEAMVGDMLERLRERLRGTEAPGKT